MEDRKLSYSSYNVGLEAPTVLFQHRMTNTILNTEMLKELYKLLKEASYIRQEQDQCGRAAQTSHTRLLTSPRDPVKSRRAWALD